MVLGRIAEAYGVKGWLKVLPYADDPQDWRQLPSWWIGKDGTEDWLEYQILDSKLHNDLVLVQLAGVDDRTAAESLKGMLLRVPRDALPELPEGEVYWGDLIGLEVVNQEGFSFGKVSGLLETGANDVLKVLAADGQERLLPYVNAVVVQVDLAAGRLSVDWGADW